MYKRQQLLVKIKKQINLGIYRKTSTVNVIVKVIGDEVVGAEIEVVKIVQACRSCSSMS